MSVGFWRLASRYREAVVVLTVCFLIVGADALLRAFGHRLSGNLAHIEKIPDLLTGHERPGEPSLLLVGNSLTNNGVDAHDLSVAIGDVRVAKVTPDATSLWDWQCLLDNKVLEKDVRFQTVVIGFAWHQLSDQTAADPSRLGAFHCEFADLAHPERIGLDDIDSVGEFVTARMLRLYAVRDTLRNRLLNVFVPHYAQFTQLQNRQAGDTGQDAAQATYSYGTLAALAQRMSSRGFRLVVVAMPVRAGYPLDPALTELARQDVVSILDYRELPGIDATSFEDPMHLNRDGQIVLTARLSSDLAPVVHARLSSLNAP